MAARRYLSSQSFLEIETPLLVKPTPEGARDYVVPSRVHPGKFYALPQSPQLYKQVLMISGCDRYFQIARCLRDEDLRADRQPEHTQIDVELSFVTEEDVFIAIEGLMAAIWRDVLGVELKTPFPRLTFRESLMRFGSDKPDVRFGMEFVDVTMIHARSPRRVIAEWAQKPDGVGVALLIPGGAEISGTQLRKYEDVVKAGGAGGLSFFKVLASEREKQQVIFPGELLDEFLAKVKAQQGDAVVFASGPWEPTLMALGALRKQLGEPRLKGKENEWAFLWVKEFPLFEWDAHRKGWAPRHHMFTMPRPQDLASLESDPAKVHGILYDLVLNGNELGSGSIRIHRTDIQERVMKVIGLSKEEAYRKFGFLLEAYQYASPPHGGIGLGLDRIVMLLCGEANIREVIAFPKTASATSPMDGSPSEVEPETLAELRIKIEPPGP
jgi:aspartyl-tRNA synthetase